MDNYFQSVAAIDDEVLVKHVTNAPCPAIPTVCNLTRQANRRQKDRPKILVDLEFKVDLNHVPDGFLQADVKVGDRRHLVFSTQHMLSLLATSKTWYMDATFEVVKEPVTKLSSIHAL